MWVSLEVKHFRWLKIDITSLNTGENLSPLLELRSLYYNLPFYLSPHLEFHGGTTPLHCAVCCIRSRAMHLVRRYNRFSIVVTVSLWHLFGTPSRAGSVTSQTNLIQNQYTNVSHKTCFRQLLAQYTEMQ
jgi:hypothetical protein